MKKIENNFTVTGFLGKDAEIREFTNSSVARFPLAVSRQERNAEETNRISAFMNIETWRKNENTGSFDQLTKGTMLTIEGYFRSEEWTDKGGVKHNRIVMVAVKFYPPLYLLRMLYTVLLPGHRSLSKYHGLNTHCYTYPRFFFVLFILLILFW